MFHMSDGGCALVLQKVSSINVLDVIYIQMSSCNILLLHLMYTHKGRVHANTVVDQIYCLGSRILGSGRACYGALLCSQVGKTLELAVIKYQFRKLLMLLGIIRKSTSARARKTETLRQKRRNLSSLLRRISGTRGFENYCLSNINS